MNALSHAGMNPISTGSDWTFELIERYEEQIRICAGEFGLDTYPNQIEIITSEQMLDAYASTGLPIGYQHWSYGKQFIANVAQDDLDAIIITHSAFGMVPLSTEFQAKLIEEQIDELETAISEIKSGQGGENGGPAAEFRFCS